MTHRSLLMSAASSGVASPRGGAPRPFKFASLPTAPEATVWEQVMQLEAQHHVISFLLDLVVRAAPVPAALSDAAPAEGVAVVRGAVACAAAEAACLRAAAGGPPPAATTAIQSRAWVAEGRRAGSLSSSATRMSVSGPACTGRRKSPMPTA